MACCEAPHYHAGAITQWNSLARAAGRHRVSAPELGFDMDFGHKS